TAEFRQVSHTITVHAVNNSRLQLALETVHAAARNTPSDEVLARDAQAERREASILGALRAAERRGVRPAVERQVRQRSASSIAQEQVSVRRDRLQRYVMMAVNGPDARIRTEAR